jgi:hypothetical protein
MHPNTKDGLKDALVGFLAVAIPTALTLMSVKSPGTLVVPSPDPSPHGYTTSLLFFIVPDVLLVRWLLKHPSAAAERWAFFATVAAVFAVGCVLDFGLAYQFFYYPNTGATLGIRLPAYDLGHGWIGDVLPIEEFGFYAFGALFMAGLYVWADLSLFPKHGKKSSERALEMGGKSLWQFHLPSLVIGLVLSGLAVVVHWALVPGGGFPGYFVFLVCIGFVPTSMLYPVAAPLMNWTAFTVMFLTLQLVSIVWEATLAVPYNWWNYHHETMVGLFIGAWAQLPIESVMMWVVSGWAVAIIYEVFRVWFHKRNAPAFTLPPTP